MAYNQWRLFLPFALFVTSICCNFAWNKFFKTRRGSSKIHRSCWNILNLRISTIYNKHQIYKYLVLGHEEASLERNTLTPKTKYSEDDIIKMLEFLVDNIFMVFAGKVLASRFNFTYRYIDDVLSTINLEFENYLGQMYPVELEIKDTTENNTSASYLDLLLSIGRDGQLHTSIYDKCDDFIFHITNFPFLSSNIPTSPAYGVFISQLIRYALSCSSYGCFILRATRLSNKLLEQGYVKER